MKTPKRTIVGTLVTGILALGGLAMGAGTALAAPAANGVDPDLPVSLTITKLEMPEDGGSTPSTGSNTTTGTPVAGVDFTLERVTAIDGVGVNLTESSTWENIAALEAGSAAATFGGTINATTDPNGQIVLGAADGLVQGVYRVTETKPGQATNTVAPFYLTLPYPDAGIAGGWNYSPEIFPKNSVLNGSKEVEASNTVAVGDNVSWNIKTVVPHLASDDSYSSFIITDQLDPRLRYVSSSVTGLPAGSFTVVESNGTVTFTVTDLTALEDAAGQEIVLTLVTTVVEIGDGDIENSADIQINDGNLTVTTDPNGGGDGNLQFGTFQITKVEKGNDSVVLAGAEFQVFRTQADANAGTNPISFTAAGETKTTFVTEANGIVTIPGLKVGNYWLKETKAPTGYSAPSAAQQITIAVGANSEQIENVKVTGPTLPGLGATGAMAASVAGAALVFLALGYVLYTRKKAGARD